MVGEFESLSVPPKTRRTTYEPSDFGLTENTRFALTALSEFGGYRTFDRRVNSLCNRFNRRRSIHRPSHAVLSRFSSHAFLLTVTSLAPFGSDRKYQARPYSRGTKPGNPQRSTFCTGRCNRRERQPYVPIPADVFPRSLPPFAGPPDSAGTHLVFFACSTRSARHVSHSMEHEPPRR